MGNVVKIVILDYFIVKMLKYKKKFYKRVSLFKNKISLQKPHL